MKKVLLVLSVLAVILFSSCNANILREDVPTYNGGSSSFSSSEQFRGEAPKNIYASKSFYPDEILVTFDSVPGADYYEIYSVKLPRTQTSYNEANLNWLKSDTSILDDGGREIQYVFTPDATEKDNYYYLFRVRGASITGANNVYEGEVSEPAEGWTLSPPTSLTTSQGEYSDRINLSWEMVDNVRGYNVYKRNSDSGEWEKVNEAIVPSPENLDYIVWPYTPSTSELGRDLYFTVSAISIGGRESNQSGSRNGYTYVAGSPSAPTNLEASMAEFTNQIVISWDVPRDAESAGYVWEIYKSTKNTNERLLHTFDSNELEGITKENDKYYYTDTLSLEQNTEYTYRVRALVKAATESDVDKIGPASSTTGCIISSPTDVTLTVNYPEGDSLGSFDFAINTPPIGYSDSKSWTYVLYGKSNNGSTTSAWESVALSSVSSSAVNMHFDYTQEQPYNEFFITLRDINGSETLINERNVIVTDNVNVENIRIRSNAYNEALTANSNGVYPVWLALDDAENFKEIELKITTSSGESIERTVSLNDLKSANFALTGDLSPSAPFESFTYSVKGNSYFGRSSSWSTNESAYGAVTGEKFIKLFEAYAMKPWEFVAHSDFPQNLKNKWNNNEMHTMIDAHGTGSLGDATTASEYHGGSVQYHSGMGNGFTGTVTFTYRNFGELEGIYSNGSYTMENVNMSGNGNTVRGTITVGGMYPATVDLGSLTVSSYAFAGSYRLTQNNGSGTVTVAATRNE